MKKFCKAIVLIVLPIMLNAGSKNLFDADFSVKKDLNDWIFQDKKKQPQCFKFQDGVLWTSPRELGGLFARLPEPLEINDSVKKAVMTVVMKQVKDPARIVTFALSTEDRPSPGYASPFKTPGAGGVFFSVCYFNSKKHQEIGWRQDGKVVISTRPPMKPYNMTNAEEWYTLTFTLDNENKTLTEQSSLGRTFSLQKADLNGLVLKGLFIPAMGVSYKSVKLTVER